MLTDKLISTHSCPITISFDNGTEYKNDIVKEGFKNFKIERIYKSPYHPGSNGELEEWHRMLHDGMKKMI